MPGNIDFDYSNILNIASNFIPISFITNIEPLTKGNINDTYLIFYNNPQKSNNKIILQRINTNIFKNPFSLMHNIDFVINHSLAALNEQNISLFDRRWEIPRLIRTIVGNQLMFKSNENYWRSFSYISSSNSFDKVTSVSQAYEVGYGLATFHYLTRELRHNCLHSITPNLHSIPKYLSFYDDINFKEAYRELTEYQKNRICKIQRYVDNKRFEIIYLFNTIMSKASPSIVHGDPKIGNILFDQITNKSLALIDLDTVSFGFPEFDIGDCLRSACNPLGEETNQYSLVQFNMNYFSSILKGFSDLYKSNNVNYDFQYIPFALKIITYELALRFFIDFMKGNLYFKTVSFDQNLVRSEVQFLLYISIENYWDDILRINDNVIN